MSTDPNPVQRQSARRNANTQFDIWEQRTALVKKQASELSTATDAKTAKLRALRLAKEEADKLVAEDAPVAAPAKPRVRRVHVR